MDVSGETKGGKEDALDSYTEASSLSSSERKSMIINERFQIPFLGALDDDKVHEVLDMYNTRPKQFLHSKEYLHGPVKSFMFSEEEDYNGYI